MLTAAAIAIAYFVLAAPWSYLVVVIAAFVDIAQIFVWLRWRKRKPTTGSESLIGARATVAERCRPKGQVRVAGQLWTATCAEGAEAGEEVRVVAVHGNTLTVSTKSAG